MLKPERMSKLFIVGPNSKLDKVVSKLHDLKVAHIIEHKKDEYELCNPLKNFEKVSNLLVQIRSTIAHLNVSNANLELKKFKINQLEKEIAEIKKNVTINIDEIKRIEDEKALILIRKIY